MGNVFKAIFGGGGGSKKSTPSAAPAAATGNKLFSPKQVSKATGDYTKQGEAKWNQIYGNMGAGGGTGGPDLTGAISSQAKTLGSKLGELTDQSGYGADGMGQLQQILKGVEGGIGAQYPVY